MPKRPVGVTILGVLAAIAAGVNLYHALQYFGILPVMLGRFEFFGQNFWGALVSSCNTLLWALVAWGLLSLKPWAWLFTIVIAVLGLASAFFAQLADRDALRGTTGDVEDVGADLVADRQVEDLAHQRIGGLAGAFLAVAYLTFRDVDLRTGASIARGAGRDKANGEPVSIGRRVRIFQTCGQSLERPARGL